MTPAHEIREEEETLLRKVQAGSNDMAIIAMSKLLELRIRKCQDRMLTCQPIDFLGLQVEAQTLMKLLKDVKQKQF